MTISSDSTNKSKSTLAANVTLLIAILLHNLTYPLSTLGGLGPLVFYLFYASIFVAGTWALEKGMYWRVAMSVSGLSVLVVGLMNSYHPDVELALAVYVTSIIYHGLMIAVLIRYTFTARVVLTDVVLAATSLYLVIGSAFAALFALIDWIQPGSFVASSGAPIGWQQLVYYSFVTLTTVGYGDITPFGFYAQSFAAFEAVIGVLYTVILLSRLVGLHASRPSG